MRGIVKVAAVKAPGFGDRRKAMLQDIAVLTGGTVISEEVGLSLETATWTILGTAKRIQISKENTTIIDGAGKADDIKGRVKQIEARSRKHHLTTIVRSFRSVKRSWLAVLPSSRSALVLKSK